MYKSPIELITSDFQIKVGKSVDEQIYNAVLNVGVNVDKPELLKALQHDRKQYQKGYADGMKDFAERLRNRVQRQGFPWEDNIIFESDIDEVLKEMESENK